MKVYYGFTKLTKKAVRKKELAVFYEDYFSIKNDAWIERRMTVVHTRIQTPGEKEDGKQSNRMFTKYSSFIDEKPFYGDIDRVLLNNYNADINNVEKEELEEIRKKLREAYFECYDVEEKRDPQLTLKF